MKKIEALKAQADAKALELKERLQQKRREAYERELKEIERQVCDVLLVKSIL